MRAFHAADDAYRQARPEVDLETARREVARAIHWASVEHNAWLYSRERPE
jgi:hypothetical protein